MHHNNKSTKKKNNGNETKKYVDEIKDKVFVGSKQLPVKVFENRVSVLTELLQNKQMASVYHFCIALFIGMCMNSLVHDYVYNGQMRLGYNLVSKGFKNMHVMIMIWFLMFFLSLLPYYGVKYWMQIRNSFKRTSLQRYLWDRICLMCYVMNLFFMLYCGTPWFFKSDMGFASRISAAIESIRLLMKVYSFVRVCTSRVVNHPEKYSTFDVKFSHYIYYSFAPTLLYRDSYPRLPGKVRWGYVATCAAEFVASVFCLSMMFERTFGTQLQNYGKEHFSVKEIAMIAVNNAPYGLFHMFVIHYLLLHLWMNAFSEMLRFSDRLFYKDWWTSETYERYYRTWNTVVHDWLYEYVYRDFFENVLPKRRILGKVAVFFLSSFFHDYAVSLSLGFFIPVFFTHFFIIGELIAYLKFPNSLIGNVFLFYSLGFGSSLMFTTYTLEYYSRVNCVNYNLSIVDYFIPKIFECYK